MRYFSLLNQQQHTSGTKSLYLLLLLLIVLSGCADTMGKNEALTQLQQDVEELKDRDTRIEARLDELNNKIFLLQDKIEATGKEVKDLKSMAVPIKPPEELEVVKVKPEDKGGVSKQALPQKDRPHKPKISPEKLYQKGYSAYLDGRLKDARDVFRRFVREFPDHPLADNAQYWIGETYYTEKDFENALKEFAKVVDNFPQSNKAPDALLKVAFSFIEMGDRMGAKEALEKLIDTYPGSEAARVGKKRLSELMR